MRRRALVTLALALSTWMFACRPSASARSVLAGASGAQSAGGALDRPPPWVARDVAGACESAPVLNTGSTVRGVTLAQADRFHATCGFGAASGDAVYRLRLERPARVIASLSASHDTVLSLRGSCWDETTELACNDDEERGTNSRIDVVLPAGDYTLVVDGYGTRASGAFALRVDAEAVDRAPTPRPTVERTREGEGASVREGAGVGPVTGTALFAKRSFTARGLSRSVRWMPVAHAHVEALDDEGRVLRQGSTDERGAFSLDVPTGRRIRVRLSSRTTLLGSDLRVVSDPGTERTFDLTTSPFESRGGEVVSFRADVGGVEPAGAFNILANFVRYLPHVHRAFDGRVPPPLFAFWRRGNNESLPQGSITAFLGPYERRAGAYSLQIQGGVEGREDASDSDQFDDPVVLHEFSHYVIGTMAGHFSIGGNHPSGALYYPALAMDEGFANALACAVAGGARYWDTAGLEPEEPLAQSRRAILIDEEMERLRGDLRGIGSQDTAQALLWDLLDGANGLPDEDGDGVAMSLTDALRVYRSFRERGVPPAMNTWLERAVELGAISEQQARSIVARPEPLGFSFPVQAGERWPHELALGAEVRGRIDGRSQPAPSGGRNFVFNGLDASRVYSLFVPSRRRVTLELVIDGDGTQQSQTDLDLHLAGRDLHAIARSDTYQSVERIERELDEGYYLVLVRDGDAGNSGRPRGNRATFTLRAR